MKTVYDESGTAFEVEAVDAREYVETGRYSFTAPIAGTPVADAPKTMAELKAALSDKGIPFPNNAKLVDLQEIYAATR